MAGAQLPAIGDLVWVSFEHGDSDYPIWEPEAGQNDGHASGGYRRKVSRHGRVER